MAIKIFWVWKVGAWAKQEVISGRFLPFIPILALLLFLHPFSFPAWSRLSVPSRRSGEP